MGEYKPSLRPQLPAAGQPHLLVLASYFGIYCRLILLMPHLINTLLSSLLQDPCFSNFLAGLF